LVPDHHAGALPFADATPLHDTAGGGADA
jgi:hypothetical protein